MYDISSLRSSEELLFILFVLLSYRKRDRLARGGKFHFKDISQLFIDNNNGLFKQENKLEQAV